MIEFDNKSEL